MSVQHLFRCCPNRYSPLRYTSSEVAVYQKKTVESGMYLFEGYRRSFTYCTDNHSTNCKLCFEFFYALLHTVQRWQKNFLDQTALRTIFGIDNFQYRNGVLAAFLQLSELKVHKKLVQATVLFVSAGSFFPETDF